MKISKKKLMKSLEIFIVLFLLILIYFNGYDSRQKNIFVIITFMINGLIIILNIVAEQKDFSLNKTFWYFNFFFFFIAPLLQYLSSFKMWNFRISDNLYLKTNCYVMLCYLIYMFSKVCLIKNHKEMGVKNNKTSFNDITSKASKKYEIIYSKNILILLMVCSFISFAFLVINISFKGLFIRSLNSLSIGDNTISVILENLFRSIPIYSTVYSIYYYRQKREGISIFIIELIILIMVNFPASITRYWIGLVYIGLLLILFGKKINGRKFDICLIVIFAVIFPIFQLFKWYSFSDLLNGTDVSKRLFDVYNSVDFDAYSLFARSINFVAKNGMQLGHQILASIFFIVPRAIWPTKPYPTGQFIAMTEKQIFTNLSCPFFAEGYVDFGIIGSLIYTFIISYIINKMDNVYWNKKENNDNRINLIDFSYPFLFGILIFLLRGSLQPVVVYTFTFFIFIFVIKKICLRKEK